MHIRREQMDVFERQAEENYVHKLEQYLRQNHAEAVQVYPNEQFHQMVINGIARARRHGLTFENKIAFFVALMFEIAPNFDEHPRIRDVLEEASLPPDERIDRLTEWVIDRDWNEAKENLDTAAWGLDTEVPDHDV
jgi:hypothetical protein